MVEKSTDTMAYICNSLGGAAQRGSFEQPKHFVQAPVSEHHFEVSEQTAPRFLRMRPGVATKGLFSLWRNRPFVERSGLSIFLFTHVLRI